MLADLIHRRAARVRPLGLAFSAFVAFASATAPVAAQTPSQSDLTALRFYYEQENDAAVRSEIRRLMMEFPDWTPPGDVSTLFLGGVGGRIDEVYRLIEAAEFDAARQLIAEIDEADSEWTPPADLMTYLNISQAQMEFDTAEREGNVASLLNIVRGVPSLLSCDRVNNAWLLADAHLDRGDTAQAMAVYRAVTQTCTAPETLIATLEKAAAIAPTDTLAELSDTAQTQAPDAVAQIRQVEDRLRAGRQEEPRWMNGDQVIALQIPGAAAAPQPAPEPSEDDTVQANASTPVQNAPAPVASSGGGSGGGGGGALLNRVRAAAAGGAWAQCLNLSEGATNLDVLFQRGWCAYNAERPMEAIAAFDSVARRANDSEVRRDASYGLLLSMLRMNMTEQAAQIAAAAPLTRTQRIEVEGQILDQRGVRAYENGDYARASAFFQAHSQLTGQTRRDLQLLHGYALLNAGERREARAIFERLHRQLATPETRRALRAAR